MISIIVNVTNEEQYNNFFLPGLEESIVYTKKLGFSNLDIIAIRSTESITKIYNDGIRRAKYAIKVFVHQDVKVLNVDWITKLFYAFAVDCDIALVGVVGSTLTIDDNFCAIDRKYKIGELFLGKNYEDVQYNIFTDRFVQVQVIDRFFMATNRSIFWDENLKETDLYDVDYCNTINDMKLKIATMPHKMWHIGDAALNSDRSYFDKKWQIKQRREGDIKLHLGCGNRRKDGYINVDVFPGQNVDEVFSIDSIPYDDNSVTAIYSEHVLEHLPFNRTEKAIKEFYRVLKEGAELHLKIPDLEQCCKQYVASAGDAFKRWWYKCTIYGIQQSQAGEPDEAQIHKSGFSKDEIKIVLERNGFKVTYIENYDGFKTPSVEVKALKLHEKL